ncbi:interleukin-17A-like [Arapaima gigas]
MVSITWLMIGKILAKDTSDTVCGSTLKIPKGYHRTQLKLQNGNRNIHNRSLSAWTWTMNHEENRIPKTIAEAVCNFTYCINLRKPNAIELDDQLLSMPIHQNVLVLNLVKPQNCYQASLISVAVGCTCVKSGNA